MINLVVEGPPDETIVRRVLDTAGLRPNLVIVAHGKPDLLKRLAAYNRAARYFPWLCLVDLDSDPRCVPEFVHDCLPERHPNMLFRVAVREIEAWLMADRQRCAAFLQVGVDRVPLDPESLPDPKRTLVDLARHSRSRDLVRDMVPRVGSGASEGPAYVSRLQEFVTVAPSAWRPEVAEANAPSLRRCLTALKTLVTAG